MDRSGKILDLRTLLTERFPAPTICRGNRLTTGLPALDRSPAGGLPKGGITELISPKRSAGSASLIASLLRSAQADSYFVALIDGCDSFDPQPLGNDCLQHLLWLRCRTTIEAIKAADLLLRDANFPLVIVDLVLNSSREVRKIPQTTWYRFQRLVETGGTAVLVLNRLGIVSSAELKILIENDWTLRTMAQENAISNVRMGIRRSHFTTSAALVANE